MKSTVSLHQRESKSTGKISLFLKYTIDGKRTYEALNLYLLPGKKPVTLAMNRQTMETAKMILLERQVELQNKSTTGGRRRSVRLTDYWESYVESRFARGGGSYKNHSAVRTKWVSLFGDRVLVADVTKEMMLKFATMLKNEMPTESSANHYFNIITTVLEKAFKDGLSDANPAKMLDRGEKPKGNRAEREFLTLEEVAQLDATPCVKDEVKRAFLFSCFTGLRYSDIRSLTWSEIKSDQIVKRMEKTEDVIYLPLSSNALRYLPPRKVGKVFALGSDTQMSRDLKRWIADAGVTKHITFHCARHTFATLLVSNDVDIYTVSKLLGHHSVNTTSIYAALVSEKKRMAVDAIPKL